MNKALVWVALGVSLLSLFISSTKPSSVDIGQLSTGAAVRVKGGGAERWPNGVLVLDGAIREDGAVVGVVQTSPMRSGIDFSAAKFSDAAIRVGSDQIIRLDGTAASSPAQFKNDGNGFLNIVPGSSGLVIRSNDNTRTLVSVKNDGSVEIENGVLILRDASGKRYRLAVGAKGDLTLTPVQ